MNHRVFAPAIRGILKIATAAGLSTLQVVPDSRVVTPFAKWLSSAGGVGFVEACSLAIAAGVLVVVNIIRNKLARRSLAITRQESTE